MPVNHKNLRRQKDASAWLIKKRKREDDAGDIATSRGLKAFS
jgi:hypothetical protein